MSARLLVLLLLFAPLARADVLLNEISIQGTERVELFNSGAGIEDVNGWTIQGSGSWIIAGAPPILPGTYITVDPPGDIFDDQGGFIELLDGIVGEDGVSYGQVGSAPLPPGDFGFRATASLARAPDGSTYSTAPPNSPATDGTIWTIDLSPTFGAINDAPLAALGTTVVLNELDTKPVGGGDLVELYNPSPLPVDVTGWLVCNGDAFHTIASGSVPGGGFFTLTTAAGFDLEVNEVVYLFRADEVRVDQIGLHLPPVARSIPTLDFCQCYARWTDGAGPNLGYDWFSSGGEVTLLKLLCTPGSSNQLVTSCQTTSAPELHSETWGRVKVRWR